MDLFKVVKKRHSYRDAYLDQEVPHQHLLKILEAGILAPSGHNAQSTDFVVVTERELLNQIAEITEHKQLFTARALIVCLINEPPKNRDNYYDIEDCAAAVENILLAITAMGYASVWLDGILRRDNRASKIARLLGIPENKIVRVILPIGKPAKINHQPLKRPLESRVWFNRYTDD